MEEEKESFDYKLSELVVSFNNEKEKISKMKEINEQISLSGFDKTVLKYSELSKNNLGSWMGKFESLSKNIYEKIINMEIDEISDPIVISNTILF